MWSHPAFFNPSIPALSFSQGRSSLLIKLVLRSGTVGSFQRTNGMCSWSQVAGVCCISLVMNSALAAGPIPPSMPRRFIIIQKV